MSIRVRAAALAAFTAMLPLAAARAADPVDLNVIIPLTGPAAQIGESEQKALALEETALNQSGGIGGRPIHFVIHDDQTSPQVALQLATQILASGANVVLGPSLSSTCNAVAPLFGKGAVAYCFSPGIHPAPGAPMFTSLVSTEALAEAMIRYLHLRGWNRVALMASTDASGQDGEGGIDRALARPEFKDMTLVAREHFAAADVSTAAQIARVRAAAPQALITWTSGLPWGTVLKDLSQSGLSLPVISSGATMSAVLMSRFASILPEQLYFGTTSGSVVGDIPQLDKRVVTARKKYFDLLASGGQQADTGTEAVWDSTAIVVEALRHVGAGANADQVQSFIARMKYAGVTGLYDFQREPQRGLTGDNGIVARWDPAKKLFVPASSPGGRPIR